MPVSQFDQRLNRIFVLREEVEAASIAGDQHKVTDLLAEALAYSCLLFQQINDDSVILSADIQDDAWKVLLEKKRTGELAAFIETERDILGRTKLNQATVNAIIGGLEATIELIMANRGRMPHEWKNMLALFTAEVCTQAGEAGETGKSRERQALLKRAFLAAGGVRGGAQSRSRRRLPSRLRNPYSVHLNGPVDA